MKQHQKDIVYQIVKEAGSCGIRTEVIKRLAMLQGISCPDRYLRYLQADNKIDSCTKPDDRTKTWWIIEEPVETHTEKEQVKYVDNFIKERQQVQLSFKGMV